MKPDHVIRLSLKKRPMTAAERARKYRERRKLKLLGASTNLLEQTLNTSNALILPEELTNGENESWSKDTSEYQSDMDAENIICSNQKKEILETPENTGIVIEIEPGLSNIIHQANLSHGTKDYIEECNRLQKAASHLEDLIIEVNHRTSSYQEEVGNYQNSENADNKDHSSAIKSHSSVEESSNNEKTAKKGANKLKNYSTNMCDQQQQNNEIPGAAVSEKSMTKLNGDKPTTEPVLNEVLSKRPMTAAERKRKSRAKQRAEGKYQHKQEKCPCGTNMKTRDKLKMEVDALIQRKELLSSQITLLQSQSQQVKLGFIENDSENELSNISTNGSSIECSRSKGISFVSQTKMKGAVSIDKGHEVNSARKSFFVINGMLDDFQVFGEFVARELRNLRSDFNRRRLKRMIQKVIIEVSESDD